MDADRILQPGNKKELLDLLASVTDVFPVAGGTDAIIRLRNDRYTPTTILDLSHLGFMQIIQPVMEGLLIGAGCSMATICTHPLVLRDAPALATAASNVGSTQIRNLATIGGNVATAAQCADTIPALIAYDAVAIILRGDGSERHENVAALVHGIGKTSLSNHEILTGFILPRHLLGSPAGFGKVGSRKAVTIAKINGAGVFTIKDGMVASARIAFGSIGTKAFLADEACASLEGKRIDSLVSEKTLDVFTNLVENRIGNRPSVSYKRIAVRSVVADIINQAFPGPGAA